MGVLRVILALAVFTTHAGPLLGLRFFDGGVMAVETFFMFSGFYMALILENKYRDRTRDFYFNRALRLFPVYWMLLGFLVILGAVYGWITGNPLGALADWYRSTPSLDWLWAGFANFLILGGEWIPLHSSPGDDALQRLIFIPAAWTLSLEMLFYLAAPFVLRRSLAMQVGLFVAALALRTAIWIANDRQFTGWTCYFAPSSWVFFMGGILAWHLNVRLAKETWFTRLAPLAGRLLVVLLGALIVFYADLGVLGSQDWLYYSVVGLSLPFIFTALKHSRIDNRIAAWSYPIYLAHGVVLALAPPFRHFVSGPQMVYLVLALTVLLSFAVLHLDEIIQRRFKRAPLPQSEPSAIPHSAVSPHSIFNT